ncbi:hypothetical protein Htur_3633 [Haloterrigena turkmenica DSM 5511]|uniref:Uncharacterized protein n=1 Tax=Haloterrigena turkmenica (strain ATCC 51198 / DSM 5511 / JCM 9101 / NCIMB 13204 / VKM B-1734 / 4k) TaxID=543526 RepID=D2RR99_HALTV|nr:hypothetical protein [Haloterrigena turkmenica]ADB62495.1 hypothetical protein Htur_3633 [Haloterrigena turkmenica DSM 5511]
MTPPNPPATIPDFLLDQFTDHSPATLREIGEYARKETYVAPEAAPDSIVEAFALQDEETLEAIARYADELADFLEEHDADSLTAITGHPVDDTVDSWGHQRILDWHN